MTDDTQPEAFDLADWLEAVGGGPSAKRCAALLREQHARIAELEAQLEAIGAGGVQALSAAPAEQSQPRYSHLHDADAAHGKWLSVYSKPTAGQPAAPKAVPAAVGHDEDLLEKLYWEFDSQRKKTGEDRLAFKVKMRFYASEFLRRSDGKMTFAQSVSDDMMNLADRLGSEFDDVDPRAWKHLLVYAPKAAPGEPDKLMRDCLALLESFDYEDDEDSQSKAFFNAHINADWFFHVKRSIERQLEAKAAPQQEAPGEPDRADATNLARNAIEYPDRQLTVDGIRCLAYAVLGMDKYIAEAHQPAPAPLSDDTKDAARWRWLSEHIGVAWNEGKFTSLVRIVSDKNRAALNASLDRMMTGDWSDAALATQGDTP